MSTIRKPAVAGTFYPSDPTELKSYIISVLKEGNPPEWGPGRAYIVPHAGYIYSAPIAAHAYRYIQREILEHQKQIETVVILGPAHTLAFSGIALPQADLWQTPLGTVPVDTKKVMTLSQLPFVQKLDAAHQDEHCLEVQVPFLQHLLKNFKLIPAVVGQASEVDVAHFISQVWDEKTLILISSDLSHYLDYPSARQFDLQTSEAILNLQSEKIQHAGACGRIPIQGMLEFSKSNHLKPHLLDMRSSGDTAGDKDRVVGYGAYVFTK